MATTTTPPNPAPRKQVRDMLAPGSDEEFRLSLSENTNDDTAATGEPVRQRARRSDAGIPKGPRGARKTANDTQVPVDHVLERAKRKFATLGGATTVKRVFEMLDKPLDAKESEDVEDYFYLVAKKGNIDPSQSWVLMILCGLILVLTLLGSRTGIGDMLKEAFSPKKKQEPNDDKPTDAVQLPSVDEQIHGWQEP